MWLISNYLKFLLMVLILVILLLYCYQDHFYQIHLILGILHVHPCPYIIRQQFLPQFILQAHLQGFIFHILCLHSMSCRLKWVFLVPTQTLDMVQRWDIFQFLLVYLPPWKLNCLWLIIPNHRCESLYRCTETRIIVLHLHMITLRQ